LSDIYPENKVLNFIRGNISLERIREVEEELAKYDSMNLDKLFQRGFDGVGLAWTQVKP